MQRRIISKEINFFDDFYNKNVIFMFKEIELLASLEKQKWHKDWHACAVKMLLRNESLRDIASYCNVNIKTVQKFKAKLKEFLIDFINS